MNNYVSKQEVMKEIYEYFKNDEKMTLLVGDMGFAVLDMFFKNHNDRSFNIGIFRRDRRRTRRGADAPHFRRRA